MASEPSSMAAPDHIERNRAAWNSNAAEYAEPGRRHWASDDRTWGVFGVPDSHLHLLPVELAGKDVVELGCGTGYVSAWLARRGARPWGSTSPSASMEPASVRPLPLDP